MDGGIAIRPPARARWRTYDVAYAFQMPLGVAGSIARAHPSPTIEPALVDAAAVPPQFGLAVILDPATRTARVPVAADAVTQIYGVVYRPFPFQADSAANYGASPFGAAPVPSNGAIDVMRAGYILVPIVGSPKKGDPLYVWVAASGGGHLQGGFEAVAGGASTIGPLGWASNTNWTFDGSPDAFGVGAIALNV